MPYIQRDKNGKILKISSRPLDRGELIPLHHPDVTAFLKTRGIDPAQIETYLTHLKNSDTDMARTIEDIITVLLKKNLVKITDMPKYMQDKMMVRAKLRTSIEEIYIQASDKAIS